MRWAITIATVLFASTGLARGQERGSLDANLRWALFQQYEAICKSFYLIESQKADPDAETLLRDEVSSILDRSSATQTPTATQRSNPLFAGVLIALLGGAFFLLFPLVGLALAAIGAILMIWGGILSWRKG